MSESDHPVSWDEGLFLKPHHFQASDRHARRGLRELEDATRLFPWGARSMVLDEKAVEDYRLVLHEGEFRFRDGTRVKVPDDAPVPPLHFRDELKGAALTVFLGIPSEGPGRANVADGPDGSHPDNPRYFREYFDCEDENTGRGAARIAFRRPRLRLLLSTQTMDGYETLPLARIIRTDQVGALPRINEAYVPPITSLEASPWLLRELRGLVHQIDGRVDSLADQMVNRRIAFDSGDPRDLERVMKLAALNRVHADLDAIAALSGAHPLEVYPHLCRAAGEVGLFLPERRTPALPAYDHQDLAGVFGFVIETIRRALRDEEVVTFERFDFVRVGDADHVAVGIDPSWLDPPHQLFLGVATDLKPEACDALLQRVDISIGCEPKVEDMYRARMSGLKFRPLARVPNYLPDGPVYFTFSRDPVVWEEMRETASMAIRLNNELFSYLGDRDLRLHYTSRRTGSTKEANLRFTLYVTTPGRSET